MRLVWVRDTADFARDGLLLASSCDFLHFSFGASSIIDIDHFPVAHRAFRWLFFEVLDLRLGLARIRKEEPKSRGQSEGK
ncbi:hypothetical protein EEB15_15680 [Ramlibacter sp. WS9]|nr:hypothetical protein EEB15_15680 [Ramlibacter sp. WS9]